VKVAIDLRLDTARVSINDPVYRETGC